MSMLPVCLRSVNAPVSTTPLAARFLRSSGSNPTQIRAFRCSHKRLSTAIPDRGHPTGIYYHPQKDGQWAVSLLSEAPTSEKANSIVGTISQRIKGKGVAQDPSSLAEADPENLTVNEDFIKLLHKTLKEDVVPNDAVLSAEAHNRESGWAHLTDARHPLMPGRIATPENIIASVAFVNSSLQPDSYQPNETYRVLTKEEGWMQLQEHWLEIVRKKLRAAN